MSKASFAALILFCRVQCFVGNSATSLITQTGHGHIAALIDEAKPSSRWSVANLQLLY